MGHHPYPPTQGIIPGGWGGQGVVGQPMGPPPETGLATLGLSDAAIHAIAASLQGVVAVGVGAALTSPSPEAPTGKVVTLSLLHICFVCGVSVDGYLPPI